MTALDERAASGAAPDPLILDFLDWLAPTPRPYAEVMEIWRTACPRLSVWEDAVDQRLIRRERSRGESLVSLTEAGRARRAERG